MIPRQLAELDDALSSCMKCGFCKAACPVFIGEETTSPRAKIRLARAVAAGEIEMTRGFKEQMERCINCRACAAECPSGVEPNRVALAARCGLIERDGLPLTKRLVFSNLKRPRLMAMGSKAAGLAQFLSAIDLQNNPLRYLLPIVGMRRDKDFPVMGRKSLLSLLPETLEPSTEQKTTVLYFPGCSANLIYPEIGLATVSVLRKLGAKVILPHDLVCCSTPVFNSGDIENARELALRNIEVMGPMEVDHIITSCGSCGLTISQEWSELLGLSEAEPIARKVIDISDFAVKYLPDGALGRIEDGETITYHDSCHLKRGMGVHESPRKLLRAMYGERYVEMELADRCCGGGGTFSVYHPELSQIVADTKMRCVEESGAGLIATGCPACIMQLRDSIVHRKMPQRVIHTVQLIDKALQIDK